MNVMEAMAAARPGFTPNDELIYQRISSDPESVTSLTTVVLAEQCGVSQPALTRFVKTLGYARYQDFRTDLVAWVSSQRAARPLDDGHLDYFATLYKMLARVEAVLTDAYLRDAARYLGQFDRVFATGISKSYHPAQLLEQLMIKTNRPYRAFEVGLIDEICDAASDRDLIMVFSLKQRGASYRVLQATSAKLLLVTSTPNGPLSRLADCQVVLPSVTSDPEESALSPVAFDIFVELLTRYLTLT